MTHLCWGCMNFCSRDKIKESPVPHFHFIENEETKKRFYEWTEYGLELCPSCYEVKERRYDERMIREMIYYCRYRSRSIETARETARETQKYFNAERPYFRDQQSRDFIEKNGGYGNIPPY